jgi:hypothetical protein
MSVSNTPSIVYSPASSNRHMSSLFLTVRD